MIPETLVFEFLRLYQLPLVFIGAFLFGETVIISAAFLASQGAMSIFYVALLAFLGTVISDSLWFYFGNYLFWQRKYLIDNDKYQWVIDQIRQKTGNKSFLALLFIKFLYGTRVLTIIYLSTQKLKFRTFLLFNSLGTMIWLSVILPIGWLAGKGIANFVSLLNKIEYLLIALVIFVIIFRMAAIWLTKKLTKE